MLSIRSIRTCWDSVTAAYPNHIWGIDITYIRLRAGWMYLVAILDWFSRYVVAWELDQTLEIGFVLAAVDRALAMAAARHLEQRPGQPLHEPAVHRAIAGSANVRISMDGKGRALDNIFTERLWRTVKYENVYLADYEHAEGGSPGADAVPGVLQPGATSPGAGLSDAG